MPNDQSPCNCSEHKDDAPTVIDEHEFVCETHDESDGWSAWRWTCACGSKGQWQYQAPNVAYHSWLKHVQRQTNTHD